MLNRTYSRVTCAAALLVTFTAAGSAQTASRDRILRAVDPAATSAVRGTAHPLARIQFDQGRTSASQRISGASLVFRLSPAQQSDLDHLLQQQQDPSSPNYHNWLTPEQYAARFGMTSNDLAKVTSWLQSRGLRVEDISPSRTEVFFSGTVAQIEYALQTEIHNYSSRGEKHFATAIDVSLPAAFSADVIGVRGLDDFHPQPRVKPVPRFTSSVSGNHFLIPGDFATIYHLGPLYSQGLDGSGQKIAVIGQTAINLADIRAFRSASGLSQNDPTIRLVPSTGASTTCSGDVTEADLDVEWSGAVAKNANVIYVYVGVGTGGTCTKRTKDVFDALQYAINNNIAPVISISYGNCEANIGSSSAGIFRQWIQQSNTQGQTVTAASGDDGAADCDFNNTSATHGLAVDIPAAIPEVTGIGGTEFTGDPQVTVNNGCAPADTYWSGSCSATSGASALSYIPETVWNDPVTSSGFSSGGGGASATGFFSKPSWQAGPGVPSDGRRDVPDISLNASPNHDPYLICTQGSCVNGFRSASNNVAAVGGTSAGAPAFAGILAIINQATQSSGQGNANSTLYSLAVSTPSAFHDTSTGDNKVPCTKGTTGCPNGGTIGFSAAANYDQASGLGSIDVFNLVTAWPGFVATPGFSVASSPAAITIATAGQSGSSTVTVGQINGFTGTVTLSCAVPSTATSKISCSVAPSSVVIDTTNTSQTATLTVNALAASASLRHRKLELLAAFTVIPGLFLLGAPRRRRGMKLLGILVLGTLGLAAGCGGGSSSSSANQNQNTSATYAVTVNATSGSVTHSSTVNVTVK